MGEIITLSHGSGGKMTNELINDVFLKYFTNDILDKKNDAGSIDLNEGRFAYTTDSFVITPIFFRGGDIGKISVCGTLNDLCASGAKPLYMSAGFILEEGLSIENLERIVDSMAKVLDEANVKLIAADTKVVSRGAADQIFINTSGIGIIQDGVNIHGANAKPGDKIIITGDVGDHGCSILMQREELGIEADIKSYCAPLNDMIQKILKKTKEVHVMRDPTRGGIATTLNEIAEQSNVGIKIYEQSIPIKREVSGVCELLGLDPLYMANEGKMLIIAPSKSCESILETLKNHKYAKNACIIGEVTGEHRRRVIIKTITGGSRILDMLIGDQLPRIC